MAGDHRVDVTLHRAALEHLEDHARILGIVLVPGVEHRLTIARLRNRGNSNDLEACNGQSMCQGTVIVPSWLEGHWAAAFQLLEKANQPIEILSAVGHLEADRAPLNSATR